MPLGGLELVPGQDLVGVVRSLEPRVLVPDEDEPPKETDKNTEQQRWPGGACDQWMRATRVSTLSVGNLHTDLVGYLRAVTVISTFATPTSFATPTVVRAGRGSLK